MVPALALGCVCRDADLYELGSCNSAAFAQKEMNAPSRLLPGPWQMCGGWEAAVPGRMLSRAALHLRVPRGGV